MNLPCTKNQNPQNNEAGVYLPFLAGAVLSLFVVLAFAGEAAYIYLHKQRLQRSFDAAATSAVFLHYRLLTENKSKSDIHAALRDAVSNHLKADLTATGVEYEAEQVENIAVEDCTMGTTNLVYKSAELAGSNTSLEKDGLKLIFCNQDLQIEGKIRIQPLLLGAIPGTVNEIEVKSSSRATNQRVAVSMILDISGSMSDPSDPTSQTSDSCQDPQKLDPVARELTCFSKLNALKMASELFINRLIPGDEVAIITFAARGNVLVPLKRIAYTEEGDTSCPSNAAEWPRDCFIAKIKEVSALGATNIFDGLEYATAELNTASAQKKKVAVMISDGAPMGYLTSREWVGAYSPNTTVAQERYERFLDARCVDNLLNRVGKTKMPSRNIPKPHMYWASANASDSLRASGGQIFTIGFGKLDGTYTQPHQNITTTGDRLLKEILLHRIAGHRPDSSLNWPTFNRENTTTCVPDFDEIAHLPEGEFFHAKSGQALDPLLQVVGRKMRARITR